MAFYLGIDGGGTKTTCVLGDETSVLGRATAGGSNVVRLGEQAARAALHQAVQGACENAKITPQQITRTVAGIAGTGRPETKGFLQKVLCEIVSGGVVVVTDADTALHAAFADGPGVVVISGTGSIAIARDGKGQTSRAGGWGWAISDEGSGPWIGRAAVTAILRARDAGSVYVMEQAILQAWRVSDIHHLVQAANATPPPDFGALLPVLVEAANSGDAPAREIFRRAGEELARLALVAANRLFATAVRVPVAMSGGAFAHAPNLLEAFYNSLQAQLPNASLLPELVDPVLGALQMARRG